MRFRSRITLAAAALLMASAAWAQFGFGGGSSLASHMARPDSWDGEFHYCRAAYRPNPRGDGGGWTTDYPLADIDLSIRLSELTKTRVGRDSYDEPTHLLIQLTDPELFDCPFTMMTEVGAAAFSNAEAENLRLYLEKGGFLWADDFWGDLAWDWWEAQLRRVLPAADFPMVDLTPDHPLFHAQFEIKETPQITNIGWYTRTGGQTSERGEESAVVHTRAIFDKQGRMMVLMTHNTDFGDAFEREGDDPEFFLKQSVPGYGFGINVLLYSLTH